VRLYTTMARRGRPRLLVLNQYYAPAPEADGQLLAQLCESLADEYEITVVTARAAGPAPPGPVTVRRLPATTFPRSSLGRRASNYASFALAALPFALAASPPDAVLSFTSPPFLPAVAHVAARRFRSPLVVVSQDVFPETALALGELRPGRAARLLEAATGYGLTRADLVVAIGQTMRRRLEAKGVDAARLRVIPNWVDTNQIAPLRRDNDWARTHGLAGRFVVMHSGNVGHAQDLETLVRASTLVHDLDDLAVVIAGGGARRDALAGLVAEAGAHKVRLLPHQPRSVLSASLSAASVHVVGLARGLAGYVVPSRILGVLAAGRPVIAAAEDESETAQLVRAARCGAVVAPGDPEALADALRRAHAAVAELEEAGRRGRAWVIEHADRTLAVARYRELLREVRWAS
jgi:colanic acid biosynthesis glycosyl transferase WcaI